jgi:hypothetical protein
MRTGWTPGSSPRSRGGVSTVGSLSADPPRVARALDLSGAYLIPPFADAHNHGIGTGDEQRDRAMIGRYLRDGVLYMQSMGNAPLTRADRDRLGLGGPNGVDAMLAQGTITGTGGHPMGLLRNVLLPQGYFPGHNDRHARGLPILRSRLGTGASGQVAEDPGCPRGRWSRPAVS